MSLFGVIEWDSRIDIETVDCAFTAGMSRASSNIASTIVGSNQLRMRPCVRGDTAIVGFCKSFFGALDCADANGTKDSDDNGRTKAL
jgi:hypothetical protein